MQIDQDNNVTTAQNPPANVSNSFYRSLFEKVKQGDLEEVIAMIREHGIDVANLYDEGAFKQTPLFSACVIKDSETSLSMAKLLCEMGVQATT